MKYIKCSNGYVISQDEYRNLLYILNDMVVFSDNAIALKREIQRAVREGILL